MPGFITCDMPSPKIRPHSFVIENGLVSKQFVATSADRQREQYRN